MAQSSSSALPVSRLEKAGRSAPEPLVQRAAEALDVVLEEDVVAGDGRMSEAVPYPCW